MSISFFKIKQIDYEKLEAKKVSVVLCTMRKNPKLEMLFESLSHQTIKNFELVFVDELYESRKDYVKSLSEKFNIPTIHVGGAIPNIHALNIGTMNSSGDYIAHINDCGYYPYRWLEKHLLIATNGFFGLGSRYFTYFTPDFPIEKHYLGIIQLPNNPDESISQYIYNRSQIKEYLHINFGEHQISSPQDLRLLGLSNFVTEDNLIMEAAPGWNHGGNSMAPTEMYLAVNGYDEEYDKGYGWADCDFSVRLFNKGYKSFMNLSNWILEIQDKDHDDAENYVPGHKVQANREHNWKLYEKMCEEKKYWANFNFNLAELRKEILERRKK